MAAYNNVGANCHILQVAAGNLQLTEKQVGSGHKQRLWELPQKDKMPSSIHRAVQSVPSSKHTVIISQIVQIIILLVSTGWKKSMQSSVGWE